MISRGCFQQLRPGVKLRTFIEAYHHASSVARSAASVALIVTAVQNDQIFFHISFDGRCFCLALFPISSHHRWSFFSDAITLLNLPFADDMRLATSVALTWTPLELNASSGSIRLSCLVFGTPTKTQIEITSRSFFITNYKRINS